MLFLSTLILEAVTHPNKLSKLSEDRKHFLAVLFEILELLVQFSVVMLKENA